MANRVQAVMTCALFFGISLIDACQKPMVVAFAGRENSWMMTGIVYDRIFLTHWYEGHPENPERLRGIVEYIESAGMLARPAFGMIPIIEHDKEWIEKVHSSSYVEAIRDACRNAPTFVDADTYLNRESYDVAAYAVSGVLSACDAVMHAQARNVFCAVRPPGHHAGKSQAMGFCIFNHVAIAARFLQEKYGLRRIMIVDWDVHHGNGTQDIFYEDPDVFYFSMHQQYLYPNSGSVAERGAGKGSGTTLNVPMRAGSSDLDYIRAMESNLRPTAREFRPEFVLISAGFDAHASDPLADMQVTEDGFGMLTRIVRDLADEYCDGRLVSVLEGGYEQQGLSRSVARHLEVLGERRKGVVRNEGAAMQQSSYPVEAYMTPMPIMIDDNMSAREALKLMEDRLVSHFPVLSGERVIGVVTERDLRVALACTSLPDLQARDIAMLIPYRALPDTPLDDVLYELTERKQSCALIQDKGGQIIGIFTISDALRAFIEFLKEEDQQAVA